MSEDCLHLNIFSPPDASPARIKKVMVWIHGGGFMSGGAELYIPSKMVTDGDVMVVTIQYRLAGFGFLSSMDSALPGNMGVKDQLLALQWVKNNIRQFGGDPDDVTIFGESAGSASVSALALTPGAKDLFTKAILQSGTVLAPWAIARKSRETFYLITKRTGFYNPWDTVTYHQNAVNCLKTKTAKEIVDAHPEYGVDYGDSSEGYFDQTPLALVVDNDFFPKAPVDLLKDRDYLQRNGVLDRSYIMGITDNEGIIATMFVEKENHGNLTSASTMSALIRSIVRGYLPFPVASEDLNPVDFLYTFPRDSEGNTPLQKFIELHTDDSFTIPLMLFARAVVDASPATPVYMYLFDSEPKLKDRSGPIRGTNHGMDLLHQFEFNFEEIKVLYFYADPDPVKFPIISRAFKRYITDFEKTGKPAPGIPSAWPQFDRRNEKYLAISSKPEVRERLFAQRVSLWTEFLPRTSSFSFFGRRIGRPAYRG